MQFYTKQELQSAYKAGAQEIAGEMVKKVYEQAKFSPGCTTYAERIYTNDLIAETVLDLLKHALFGVGVAMRFTPDKEEDCCNKGFAFFTIDWS